MPYVIESRPLNHCRTLGALAYTPRVDMQRFRDVLKEIREGRGLSQPKLSELTRDEAGDVIGSQAISDIEAGATKDPGIQTVVRLVKAMKIPLSSFFGQIEGLKAAGKPRQTPAFPHGQDNALASSGGSLSASESARIGEILITAGMAVAQRGARLEVKRPDRSVPQAGIKKSAGSKPRAKNG